MTMPHPDDRSSAPVLDRVARKLLGGSRTMAAVRQAVQQAAVLDLPVLVEGETGTGKEIVARLLHDESGRTGSFTALNVAERADGLAEADLFGVVRGAYTGAERRAGFIEAADRGTLVLDEAADLPARVQARLLRVLETGLVSRMGETTERCVRFRLVVTVQQRAAELVATGRWRRDFFYRVLGICITLPPLRARGGDLVLLANHFLSKEGQPALSPSSLATLRSYPWPGNVRELARAVERAVFRARGRPVTAPAVVAAARIAEPGEGPRLQGGLHDRSRSPTLTGRDARAAAWREAERAHLVKLLRSHGGNVRTMATELGLSRSQLYRRLKAVELDLPGRRSPVA